MKTVFKSLALAVTDLFSRPMLIMVFAVPFGALALWISAAWIFWGTLIQLSTYMLSFEWAQTLTTSLSKWLELQPNSIIGGTAVVLALVLLFPLVYLTALVVTSTITMPVALKLVRDRRFKNLIPQTRPSSILPSLVHSLKVGVLYLMVWMISLPLWFIVPFGSVVIPWLLMGWLNERVFSFDVLSEVADSKTRLEIQSKHRRKFFAVGLLTALWLYIPLLNLLAPVYSALAFTQLGLELYQKEIAEANVAS